MKLRSRILGAFIIVIAVAVGVMAFTSQLYIDRLFESYAVRYRGVIAEQWEFIFRSYYQRHGSWEGIEEALFGRQRGRAVSMPQWQHGGNGRAVLPGEGLLLADRQGIVVLDSYGELKGETLSEKQLAAGRPVVVNGETVGTLLLEPRPLRAVRTLEEHFSSSVLLAVLLGGLLALGVGAGLSFLITGQITRPLAALAASARRFARRDFRHRAEEARGDEFGKLAEAFNFMAASIEKNEELRRNLLADVSHELRTPLTVLRGNFESLQAGRIKPTPELLSSLYDEVLRLGRLVNDLEAVNLAEAGKLPLNRTQVDVEALLSRAAAAFGHEAAEREIKFTVQKEGLPPWTMDGDRIMQVLVNLLANAFRFTPDGGEVLLRARVIMAENSEAGAGADAGEKAAADADAGARLKAEIEEGKGAKEQLAPHSKQLHIEVLDSGPGIPEKELPFVFERFYRAPSRGLEGGGLGLGLSIARSFVEAHGGTISAANRPEGGSIISFTLPPQF